MSTTKQHPFSVKLDGFDGITSAPPRSDRPVTTDIANFRLREDGSLESRDCYYPLNREPISCSAHIVTHVDEKLTVFLLSGFTVYRLDVPTETLSAIGYVKPAMGQGHFFYNQGTLYLLSAKELYVVEPDRVRSVLGYIPLLGKDWPNNVEGPRHEPMSLLHNHARISYVFSDPPSTFFVAPYPILSVEKVIRNGKLLVPEEEYKLDENFGTVNVLNPEAGDRVTIYFTLDDGQDRAREDLLSCRQNVFYGGYDTGRIYWWGSDHGSTMYCSEYVSEEDAALSAEINDQSANLYFPVGHQFQVGNGRYPIRSTACFRDQLMIFTEGEAWLAPSSSTGEDLFPCRGVHPAIGCSSPKASLMAENDLYSMDRSAVYHWEEDTDGSFFAVSISDPIQDKLDPTLYKRAELCYRRKTNELWLNDTENQTIWICCLSTGGWFRYTGIDADHLLELDDRMGFLKGGSVYAFDPSRHFDEPAYGNIISIPPSYSAELGDLGTEERKTLSHLVLWGDLDGHPIFTSIRLDGSDRFRSTAFNKEGSQGFRVWKRRQSSGRFRTARLELTCPLGSHAVLSALHVYAK
jgi:hypothetical protein